MRALTHLAPFIAALMINRESAAIYASGQGMPVYLQFVGALLWYAAFVAAIWMSGRWLGRFLPGKLLIVEWLRDAVGRLEGRLKRKRPKRLVDLSGFATMPRYKLLPMLLGYSLAPSGFWVNVEILRRRRCGTATAVIWLAPCNAVSYKLYYLGMSVLAVIGLDVAFAFLSEQVIPPLLVVAGLVILVDGMWYVQRRFDDWCITTYVLATVR